jgi:hypothetical protein
MLSFCEELREVLTTDLEMSGGGKYDYESELGNMIKFVEKDLETPERTNMDYLAWHVPGMPPGAPADRSYPPYVLAVQKTSASATSEPQLRVKCIAKNPCLENVVLLGAAPYLFEDLQKLATVDGISRNVILSESVSDRWHLEVLLV